MAKFKEVWNVAGHTVSPYDIIDSFGGLATGSIKTESLPEDAQYQVITSGGEIDIYPSLSEFLGGIGGSLLAGENESRIGFETYGFRKGIFSVSVEK